MALAGDVAVARMTSDIPHPIDLDRARAWLAPSKGEVRFAVVHDGLMVGSAGYFAREAGVCELGFWLGRDWWGQGLATEAAGAVARHAFEVGGVTTLTSSHFTDNPASARVLAKLGFEATGIGRIWSLARGEEVTAVLLALSRAQAGNLMQITSGGTEPAARSRWRDLLEKVRGG